MKGNDQQMRMLLQNSEIDSGNTQSRQQILEKAIKLKQDNENKQQKRKYADEKIAKQILQYDPLRTNASLLDPDDDYEEESDISMNALIDDTHHTNM